MMNFYKRDTLNDKFEEFENRFQLKLDEQNIAHKTQIQKLDDKIARLETENSRTYELIDKLYEYRFNEISCQINHQVSECNNKIDNTFKTLHEGLQKVMLLTKEKITIITDKVEICMNEIKQINILNNNQKEMSIEIKNINNKFDKDIHKLTTQQQVTTENIVELNHEVSEINREVTSIYEISISDIKNKISLLEDKLEDKQWSNCYDLKIITEDIVKLKEKQSLTDDVLLNIQNEIILINTDSRIGNKSQHNVINELSEKIKILKDNVSNIQNINNKFEKEIFSLSAKETHQTDRITWFIHDAKIKVVDNKHYGVSKKSLNNIFKNWWRIYCSDKKTPQLFELLDVIAEEDDIKIVKTNKWYNIQISKDIENETQPTNLKVVQLIFEDDNEYVKVTTATEYYKIGTIFDKFTKEVVGKWDDNKNTIIFEIEKCMSDIPKNKRFVFFEYERYKIVCETPKLKVVNVRFEGKTYLKATTATKDYKIGTIFDRITKEAVGKWDDNKNTIIFEVEESMSDIEFAEYLENINKNL